MWTGSDKEADWAPLQWVPGSWEMAPSVSGDGASAVVTTNFIDFCDDFCPLDQILP